MSVDRVAEARCSAPPPEGPEGALVYRFELDLGTDGFYHLTPEGRLLTAFLVRHEVVLPGKIGFVEGGRIEIFRQADGSFDVYVWRAVGGDAIHAPSCPSCPRCVEQERVRRPLQGSAPLLRGVWLWGEDLPVEATEEPASASWADGPRVWWEEIEGPDGIRTLPTPNVMVWVFDDLAGDATLGYAIETAHPGDSGMRLWSGSADHRITHWAPLPKPGRKPGWPAGMAASAVDG